MKNMKVIIAKLENALDVEINVAIKRPVDVISIAGKQELSKEELVNLGEILLQKGFKKQLSELYYEDAVYLENEDYLVSIDHNAQIHIMELDDL